MKKKLLFWIIAIIITLSAAFYQRITGPTYPKKIEITGENKNLKLSLPRSGTTGIDCGISIPFNENFSAKLFYKHFPTNEDFTQLNFNILNNELIAELPAQQAAGKLAYYIEIKENNNVIFSNADSPAIIRFKGDVPSFILIPHILFMFIAMLLSNYTAILAIAKQSATKIYGIITFISLSIGGMILGPVVQKYAFNEYWTGIPFGWDLTDNKTLIAFVFWLIAILFNIKKERIWMFLLAAIILLIIFSIPHSLFGSELNYSTGAVTTGK